MSREPHEDELIALLPAEVEQELAEALRAAWAPVEIDARLNEQLITLALEDPLAAPSEEEIAESERLRRALEGDEPHPLADLARAISLASRPAALEPRSAERIAAELERPRLAPIEPAPSSKARRGTVITVAFGAAAATLALAASVALFVRPMESSEQAAGDLALSRSTAAMFQEKFETGETTQRVDRIAKVRERELRSNRYALWGVR